MIAGGEPIRYMIDHVVVDVVDLVASTNAYRTQLGAEVLVATPEEAWLFHGDPVLLKLRPGDGRTGIHHVAYRVPDVDAACADLSTQGVTSTHGPEDTGAVRRCSFAGPAGLPFEVFSGEAGPPRPAGSYVRDGNMLRLHHVNLLTSNVREAIEFYERVLGLRVAITFRPDFGGFNFLVDAGFDGRTRGFMLEITGPPELDERETTYLEAHGPAYDHLCFVSADPAAAYHRLTAGGQPSLYEPEPFLDNVLAWVLDPQGIHIELMKPLEDRLLAPVLQGEPPPCLTAPA